MTCLHLAMSASNDVMMMTQQPVACSGGMTLGQSIMMCLNGLILLFVGGRYYKGAILGAMHGNFGMDCLVVTGTFITFLYSCIQLAMACQSGIPTTHVFFETTGMLLMFVTIGKFIEAYAKGRREGAPPLSPICSSCSPERLVSMFLILFITFYCFCSFSSRLCWLLSPPLQPQLEAVNPSPQTCCNRLRSR